MLKVSVINLDRHPERRQYMLQQLLQCGFSETAIAFVPAVDAKDSIVPSAYRPHCRHRSYWELTPTEIACFESHKITWRMAVQSGSDVMIVMEDDVILPINFLERSLKILEKAPAFDVIKLDYSPGLRLFGKADSPTESGLLPIAERLPSAACYAITPQGGAKLLNESNTYCDHLDEFIWTPRPGYRAFQLKDSIAIQGMFCQAAGLSVNLPVSVAISLRTQFLETRQRGPVLYRLKKEVRRFQRRLRRRIFLKLLLNNGRLQKISPPEKQALCLSTQA